jgi:hypothetical protein
MKKRKLFLRIVTQGREVKAEKVGWMKISIFSGIRNKLN